LIRIPSDHVTGNAGFTRIISCSHVSNYKFVALRRASILPSGLVLRPLGHTYFEVLISQLRHNPDYDVGSALKGTLLRLPTTFPPMSTPNCFNFSKYFCTRLATCRGVRRPFIAFEIFAHLLKYDQKN